MRHCAICQAPIEKGDAKTCGGRCRVALRKQSIEKSGKTHRLSQRGKLSNSEIERRVWAIRMAAVPDWRRVEPLGSASGECEVGR